MIKVIAFDLVGVLVTEQDIELSDTENNLERLFGDNYSDLDYINEAKKYVKNKDIVSVTEGIFNKLYKVRDIDIFTKLKNKYSDIKLVVATRY